MHANDDSHASQYYTSLHPSIQVTKIQRLSFVWHNSLSVHCIVRVLCQSEALIDPSRFGMTRLNSDPV